MSLRAMGRARSWDPHGPPFDFVSAWRDNGISCEFKTESEAFTMAHKEFLCLVCGHTEDRCTCIKYCALCQADYGVRLTEDGQFYCADCREACDYKTQEQV